MEKGQMVSFTTKKQEKTGKIVKIYNENEKVYIKIISEKKYFFKQQQHVKLITEQQNEII